MPSSRKAAREQRVREMIRRHDRFTSPPLNPQEYWSAKNYPSDPRHVDWRDPNRYFRTRLHDAALRGDLAKARRLVERDGANPFVKDNNYFFPSAEAEAEGHFEVAAYLRQKMDEAVRRWQQHEKDSGRRYHYRLS